MKSLGPTEVVADLGKLVKHNNLYRMDTAIANGGNQQTYTIDVDGGVPLTFHDTELAPPSGVFARNYARSVRRTPLHCAMLTVFVELFILRGNLTTGRHPGPPFAIIPKVTRAATFILLAMEFGFKQPPIKLCFGSLAIGTELAYRNSSLLKREDRCCRVVWQ